MARFLLLGMLSSEASGKLCYNCPRCLETSMTRQVPWIHERVCAAAEKGDLSKVDNEELGTVGVRGNGSQETLQKIFFHSIVDFSKHNLCKGKKIIQQQKYKQDINQLSC